MSLCIKPKTSMSLGCIVKRVRLNLGISEKLSCERVCRCVTRFHLSYQQVGFYFFRKSLIESLISDSHVLCYCENISSQKKRETLILRFFLFLKL